MRQIEFRGKRFDSGEWVYGNFFHHRYYGEQLPIIGEGVQNGSVIGFEVDPETVGQFTGLKDKNGVEIYEGDIVRHRLKMHGEPIEDTKELEVIESEEIGQMLFKKGCFWFVSVDGYTEICGMIEPDQEDMLGLEVFEFEVIGNIYENPELLEAANV